MTAAAIVPAAGRGERLGADRPKAFVTVRGRTLVEHAVAALRAGGVGTVVVAAPPDAVEQTAALLADCLVVAGGNERQDSVRLALAALPAEVDVVLVHDAARAFVPADVVARVVAAVRAGAPAAVPVLPLTDTVKEVGSDGRVLRTVDRAALRAVQTPQGFTRAVLERAHASGLGGATDDATLVEALGLPVLTVEGHPDAAKVTTANDLELVEALLARRDASVGA
jgi:2-C-methyl-D-erythritol 4-phosphate cytidylyltransferase